MKEQFFLNLIETNEKIKLCNYNQFINQLNLELMKLESLKLDKFKDSSLKKEQMFMLNGGGIKTGGGTICGPHGPSGLVQSYDYGYDIDRGGVGNITFHDRSNVTVCELVVFPEDLPTLTLTEEDLRP